MTKAIDSTAFSAALRRKAGLGTAQYYDREDRAQIVKETYKIDELTLGTYLVQHPTEDERAYVVDINAFTCECPDFGCRGKLEGFWCKHLICVSELTGILLPEPDAALNTTIIVPDADDPYKD